MPVSINQPLSALQRIAEELEYSELLDEAARLSGVERMIKVCVFALSTYAKDSHRPGRKPFNPILGETYELVREGKSRLCFALVQASFRQGRTLHCRASVASSARLSRPL